MDLLDSQVEPPSSDVLAAELGRLDVPAEEPYLDNTGPLRFAADTEDEPSPLAAAGGRKVAIGIAGLLAVALVGLLIGIAALSGDDEDRRTEPAARPSATATAADDATTPPAPAIRKLVVDEVRIVDPDSKRRDELGGAKKVVDGDSDEGWDTHSYTSAKFGNWKRGMGVWIDLGSPHTVKSVQVELSATGASAQLFAGTKDFASSSSGDKQLFTAYQKTPIGQPFEEHDGTTMTFNGFDADQKYRYLLFWITELPPNDRGGFKIGVQELTVQGS